MKTTQREKIIDYINRFGYITSWDAYKDLGITQLGARIFELKRNGYWFDEEIVYTKNRLGEDTHYKKYKLLQGIPQIENYIGG